MWRDKRHKLKSDVYLLLLWLRRDLKSRYAGSLGGLLWAFLLPFFTVAIFYVVFARILQVRIPQISGETGYFFYLLAGLLPWLSLSDGLSRASSALVAQEQFLQKIVFPIAILPATALLSSLLPQFIGTLILLLLLLVFDKLSLSLLLWPLVFICQLVLSLGLGFALAIVSVHVKDIIQLMPVVLQIFFYATPILYPKSLIPEAYQVLFLFNPIAGLMEAYQAVFLGVSLPPATLLSLLVWTLLLGGGGWLLFRALKPTLGDYL